MNIAHTFLERLLGAKKQDLPLFIPDCNAVHTFGLKEPIDVFWLDDKDQIIRADLKIKPNRICACLWAASVVETKARGQALVETSLLLPWVFILFWLSLIHI